MTPSQRESRRWVVYESVTGAAVLLIFTLAFAGWL